MEILQTLDRGLEALDLISRRTGGVSPSELADALGVHRAGAYRILATLEHRRLATKGHDGLYRLGSGALVVAGRFMNQYRAAAQPVVQDLADRASCTAFLTVADQSEAVALAVAEPADRATIGISYQVGARHPLALGADGVAILAQRPELPDDPESVRQARSQGFAVTGGQVQPGAVGLAVGVDPSSLPHVETSLGVIRLGHLEDLDVTTLLPLVQAARDSLARLY